MGSTFGMFETAKSGLSVSMENLKITGHNISNANTVGYTRQRLVTSAKETGYAYRLIHPTEDNTVGQGVEVLEVQQLRSSYLDQQYRNLSTSYNYSESRTQALTYLEGLFNGENEDGGLTSSMEKYFEAMNSFSKDTSSKEYRTNVQQQAIGLTENFKNVYQEMVSLWNDQNTNLSTTSQKINSIAEKISVLNDSISSYERTGEKANDLNDERNLLLDELSGYVNITYENNATNSSMIDVKIGGADLVSGIKANAIQISTVESDAANINTLTAGIATLNQQIAADPTNASVPTWKAQIVTDTNSLKSYAEVKVSANADNPDLTDITYSGFSLVSGTKSSPVEGLVSFKRNNLTLGTTQISIDAGTLTGGKLYSNMEMISQDSASSAGIPYYINQLDSLVRNIATDINTIHKTGYTYPTDTSTSVQGLNFFKVPQSGTPAADDYSLLNAGNFSITDEVLNSIYNIAGSSTVVNLATNPTETGNGEQASLMYKAATANDYSGSINSIVGHLAITLNTSKSVLDTKESLINSVDTQRTSISGVSVDEETTNLIVFQQAYSACARTITTIDEMLDTLISKTGLVGR